MDVVFLSGFIGLAMGMLAFLVWVPPARSRRAWPALLLAAGSAIGSIPFARPPAGDVAEVAALFALLALVTVVTDRAGRAERTGVPLAAGWVLAHRFARWSTLSVALAAFGVCVWSLGATILLGGPC